MKKFITGLLALVIGFSPSCSRPSLDQKLQPSRIEITAQERYCPVIFSIIDNNKEPVLPDRLTYELVPLQKIKELDRTFIGNNYLIKPVESSNDNDQTLVVQGHKPINKLAEQRLEYYKTPRPIAFQGTAIKCLIYPTKEDPGYFYLDFCVRGHDSQELDLQTYSAKIKVKGKNRENIPAINRGDRVVVYGRFEEQIEITDYKFPPQSVSFLTFTPEGIKPFKE